MKHIVIILLVLLIVSSAVCGGYFLGYQRGYHRALFLQTGTFVVSLDAMDKIRSGDIIGGTRSIEGLCFSSADIVYSDPVFRHDFADQFICKSMFDDLSHYRQNYRTNSAEWTPMEQNLEKHMANWKSLALNTPLLPVSK